MPAAGGVYPAPPDRFPGSRVRILLGSMEHASTHHASLNRTAFDATVHCLTGCAIGEILGLVIATALGLSDLPSICSRSSSPSRSATR